MKQPRAQKQPPKEKKGDETMFARKQTPGLVSYKDKSLDSLFNGANTAFSNDASDRRSRLRRSTSFESLLAKPVEEPKPAVVKVVGSVSHMLLPTKSAFLSNHHRPVFGANEQVNHRSRTTTTYKFNSNGAFKYPSPKKVNHNIFFDVMEQDDERKGKSSEKEASLTTTEETRSESEESSAGNGNSKQNSADKKRPRFALQRQLSDSSLYISSKLSSDNKMGNTDIKGTHHVTSNLRMQLNSSHHSAQRRSRRRLHLHRADNKPKDGSTGRSRSALQRGGSDPSLQTKSRRTLARTKTDWNSRIGNKSDSKIETTARSSSRTRCRRIVIEQSKGEDDDDMHIAAVTDIQRRRRRHKAQIGEKVDSTRRRYNNNGSQSDLELDDDELDLADDDRLPRASAESNDESYTFPEIAALDDQPMPNTSDHSLDFDEVHAESQNLGKHSGHSSSQQRRRRRHNVYAEEKANPSRRKNRNGPSKSDVEQDNADDGRLVTASTDSNEASYTFPEIVAFQDSTIPNASDHWIDFNEVHVSTKNLSYEDTLGKHSWHSLTHKIERLPAHTSQSNSSDKEAKISRQDSKRRLKKQSSELNLSRHEKIDLLKHKLRVREEKKLNAFTLRAHASCDFERMESQDRRLHRNGHREKKMNDSELFDGKGHSSCDFEKSALHRNADLVKTLNTLDFPIPSFKNHEGKGTRDSDSTQAEAVTMVDDDVSCTSSDDSFACGKDSSKHEVPIRLTLTTPERDFLNVSASSTSRRTLSRRSLSRTPSQRNVELGDSNGSLSFNPSSNHSLGSFESFAQTNSSD